MVWTHQKTTQKSLTLTGKHIHRLKIKSCGRYTIHVHIFGISCLLKALCYIVFFLFFFFSYFLYSFIKFCAPVGIDFSFILIYGSFWGKAFSSNWPKVIHVETCHRCGIYSFCVNFSCLCSGHKCPWVGSDDPQPLLLGNSSFIRDFCLFLSLY